MSRLAGLFESCRAEGRSALIGYLPTGYPDVQTSIDAMVAMTESGCDIIEVGVAYSDPGMDGPVIAAATNTALQGGVRVRDALKAMPDIDRVDLRCTIGQQDICKATCRGTDIQTNPPRWRKSEMRQSVRQL